MTWKKWVISSQCCCSPARRFVVIKMSGKSETKPQKRLFSTFLSASHLLQSRKQTASYQQQHLLKDATACVGATKFIIIESKSLVNRKNSFYNEFRWWNCFLISDLWSKPIIKIQSDMYFCSWFKLIIYAKENMWWFLLLNKTVLKLLLVFVFLKMMQMQTKE